MGHVYARTVTTCVIYFYVKETFANVLWQANVFEEEDFQMLTYGFKFKSNVTDLRVIGMLKEVEDEVNRTIRVRMVSYLLMYYRKE